MNHYSSTGQVPCSPCPHGSFNDAIGSSSCTCKAGYFGQNGKSPCLKCPSDSFSKPGDQYCFNCFGYDCTPNFDIADFSRWYQVPSKRPSRAPTAPSNLPTIAPSDLPTEFPSELPSESPSQVPSHEPSHVPTLVPSNVPTVAPSCEPTAFPTGTLINFILHYDDR